MALQFDDPSAYYSPSHDCTDLNDVYEPAANGILLRGEPVDEVCRLPQSAPKVSEWRPLADKTVSITVDRAREKGCDQAQHEIDFIKKNAKLVMGTGDDVPTMNDILNQIFGEHSRLYRTFVDEIPVFDGKHKFFLRCMGTFFLSCAMDFTLKELTEFTLVPVDILASKEDYSYFWKLLHDKDDSKNRTSRSDVPFWRNVESALNKCVRELFVTGMEGKVQVTIDDDKVHYHLARMMEAHEPKLVQHVRDNRRGFVIDTGVLTVSGAPVGFSAQGKNDSTTTSAKRLIRTAFAPADGGSDPRLF